jgi:hypothetical protein
MGKENDMTEVLKKYARTSLGAFAAAPMYPGAPRIAFAPENEGNGGSGDGDDAGGDDDGAGNDGGSDDDGAGDDGAGDEGGDNKGGADGKGKKKEDDEKAKLLRESMKRKQKIADLENELKKFEGIDPEAVRALLAEKRQAELAAEEAKGNFDRVKQMMAEAHDAEKKTLNDTIADLQNQLKVRDGELDKLTVGQSFALSQFISEELTLPPSKAKKVYGEYFERVDGKVVAYDQPAGASTRTILTGADGKPLSFDDALRKIVELDPEKDRLIKQKVTPGAASSSKKVDPAAQSNDKPERKLYGVSRIALGLEKSK